MNPIKYAVTLRSNSPGNTRLDTYGAVSRPWEVDRAVYLPVRRLAIRLLFERP